MKKALGILILAGSLAACNVEKPNVGEGEKLPAPIFDKSEYIIGRLGLQEFSGKCDKEIIKLELSSDGENWVDLQSAATAVDISCTTLGTFKFSLNLDDPEYAELKTKLLSNEEVKGWLRGQSEFMRSADATMLIDLSLSSPYAPVVRSLSAPSISQNGYVLKGSLASTKVWSGSGGYVLSGALKRGSQ